MCSGELIPRLRRQSRRGGAELDLRRQTSFGQDALYIVQRDGRRLEFHAAVQLASGDARNDRGALHRKGNAAVEIIEESRPEGFRRPWAGADRRKRRPEEGWDTRREW